MDMGCGGGRLSSLGRGNRILLSLTSYLLKNRIANCLSSSAIATN